MSRCWFGVANGVATGGGSKALHNATAVLASALLGAFAAIAEAGAQTVAPTPTEDLVMPESWFPTDWDPIVAYADVSDSIRSAEEVRAFFEPEALGRNRQSLVAGVPFSLFMLAHEDTDDANVWLWWTALRSCEAAVQLVDDLTSEFGDRTRGETALAQAKSEFQAWAATQPDHMNLYFTAKLGDFQPETQTFLYEHIRPNASTIGLGVWGRIGVSLVVPRVMRGMPPLYPAGLMAIDSGVGDVMCPGGADGQLAVFGPRRMWSLGFVSEDARQKWSPLSRDRTRYYSGLSADDYTALPQVHMSRADAQEFVAGNPDRQVLVTVETSVGREGIKVFALPHRITVAGPDGATLAETVFD